MARQLRRKDTSQYDRIDIFSAMLISTEIVDIQRFATPWKLLVMQDYHHQRENHLERQKQVE